MNPNGRLSRKFPTTPRNLPQYSGVFHSLRVWERVKHSSGAKLVQGSVTKHGNPRLRASLVELAWRLVRFQPGYPPVKARLPLLAKGAKATGAARKKAILRLRSGPPSRATWPSISGGCTPASARRSNLDWTTPFRKEPPLKTEHLTPNTLWNVAHARSLTWVPAGHPSL